MAKNKSLFVIQAEYIFIICFFKVIRLLPQWTIKPIAYGLGWLLWIALFKRRKIIQKNLAIAFPDKSSSFKSSIAHGFWPEFCAMLIHYIRLSGLSPARYSSVFNWKNLHYYEEAKKKKKGIIFVSAHFSIWEILGMAISYKGYQHAAVGRPLDNPKLNQLVNGIRETSGMRVIPHRNAVKESLRILKNNKGVGFVMDQNFHHGGVFIKFFSHPASMTDLPALLSLKTGAPLLPIHCIRQGNTFHAVFDKPIYPDASHNKTLASQALSQKIADVMEGWIKEYPISWLWAHDRWKRQPHNTI